MKLRFAAIEQPSPRNIRSNSEFPCPEVFESQQMDMPMKQTIAAFGIAMALAMAAGSTTVSAAPGDAYKHRKAACQERAKTMNFGVHLVKKNRWMKDCIAGKHV
jgi:hypothetical protein